MKLFKKILDLLLSVIVTVTTTFIFINYDRKCKTFQREIENTIYHYYDRGSHFIVVSKGVLV